MSFVFLFLTAPSGWKEHLYLEACQFIFRTSDSSLWLLEARSNFEITRKLSILEQQTPQLGAQMITNMVCLKLSASSLTAMSRALGAKKSHSLKCLHSEITKKIKKKEEKKWKRLNKQAHKKPKSKQTKFISLYHWNYPQMWTSQNLYLVIKPVNYKLMYHLGRWKYRNRCL